LFLEGVEGEVSTELENRGRVLDIADKKKAKSEDLAF
jgi:hypothetical protein